MIDRLVSGCDAPSAGSACANGMATTATVIGGISAIITTTSTGDQSKHYRADKKEAGKEGATGMFHGYFLNVDFSCGR